MTQTDACSDDIQSTTATATILPIHDLFNNNNNGRLYPHDLYAPEHYVILFSQLVSAGGQLEHLRHRCTDNMMKLSQLDWAWELGQ